MKRTAIRCRGALVQGALILAALMVAMGAAYGADDSLRDPYAAILSYEVGQSPKALKAIEEEIRGATAGQRLAIEGKLLGALESPEATVACKQFVCRMLRRTGASESLPALARLLADEELSHMARFALQEMQDSRVDEILREALAGLSGGARVGVVNTIAQRCDPRAVPQLVKLLKSEDTSLLRAAISALGHIGGGKAAKALKRVKVGDDIETHRADAYLMCADKMLAEGDASSALEIYSKMADEKNSAMVRAAAYRGVVLADKKQALRTVLALLRDENADLRESAGRLAREAFASETPDPAVTKALADSLPSLPPQAQVVLLSALADRGDEAALPEVAEAASSSDEAVRVQAIRALGVLGDASSAETLIQAMAEGGDIAVASARALDGLRGDGIGAALVKALESGGESAAQLSLIEVIEARSESAAVPVLLTTTQNSNSKVRKASYTALKKLAGENELPALVELLLSSKKSLARRSVERVMTAVLGRMPEPGAGTGPVIAGLSEAGAKAKENLLAVLGNAGGSEALAAIREELKNGDDAAKKASVKALGNWSDTAPAADLLAVARNDSNTTLQILAFRGYVGLAGLPSERPAGETLKMYEAAMGIAGQADARKLVLSGVSAMPSREALEFVEKYLEDEEIKSEAETAYRKISGLLEDSSS
ncbi:MAG TPA: HEAT repeat domain-containing protein [Gammaproteobacteria bacterium]|jgi:HEAT repeat protein|nr:HEAT repeat domain-containing protein [Candidatus Hydrogenedentota bacterium]HJP35456.1 HEAT repeat domain-containing protein [Gammaproteobacteria bacterium]